MYSAKTRCLIPSFNTQFHQIPYFHFPNPSPSKLGQKPTSTHHEAFQCWEVCSRRGRVAQRIARVHVCCCQSCEVGPVDEELYGKAKLKPCDVEHVTDFLQLATSFKQDLTGVKSICTCSICDEFLYEPFTISCGHTYCYSVSALSTRWSSWLMIRSACAAGSRTTRVAQSAVLELRLILLPTSL